MLVTSGLVFVHIPRTGGVFIREALQRHGESESSAPRFATHASYEELPAEFRDRPAFCVVRNPWDWYVSWYHHTVRRGPHFARLDPLDPKRVNWQGIFEGGRSSFKDAVTRVCEGRLEHPFAEAARRRDTDLYSEYVRRLAGRGLKRGSLEAGRFEELVPFLVDFLDRHGLLLEGLRGAIEASPPLNVSDHAPYREYYDPELRELVTHRARWVIERFGYAF